ncbi:MAG TPA: sialidase family protein [Chthoniobacterales bacterium]|jgi:hypothetical protein
MKNKSTQSAFFYWRTSVGVLFVLAGLFLGLLSFGQFSAQAQRSTLAKSGVSPLVPAGFDCAQIRNLGINVQENLRAGAIMIACGQAIGGYQSSPTSAGKIIDAMSAPLGADVDLINNPSPETGTHVTQSETFAAANPDNTDQVVVAFNDSRGVFASPINISGASVSTDGGFSFTRLTCPTTTGTCVAGQSPFKNTFGDPVMLYNRTTTTWYAIFLDAGCGGQGIGGYKSTNPSDPNSWAHFCVHTGSGDDRESGYADNNSTSPFFGRMYVSWNDFSLGGNLKVTRSSDGGVTWTSVQLASASPFIRDVQITGDTNGNVFVAGMDEGGGGFNQRINRMYRSTDGGVTFALTYTGPAFAAPGRTLCPNTYFVCMFSGPPGDWRHMGWGEPAVLNGVVHYVYDQHGASTDPADVYYIRSTDNGVTFSTPVKLNLDSTTKANWQPNLSIGANNTLQAVWYDEREATATCVKGDETVPCYRMYSRRSTDGGLTWLPEQKLSDVVSPLPGQPDSGIISEYAGDYDYAKGVGNHHYHPWTDGRVLVNSASQQDVFFDRRAK